MHLLIDSGSTENGVVYYLGGTEMDLGFKEAIFGSQNIISPWSNANASIDRQRIN